MSNMKRLWEEQHGDEPYSYAEMVMREAGMTRETYEKLQKWLDETLGEGKDD